MLDALLDLKKKKKDTGGKSKRRSKISKLEGSWDLVPITLVILQSAYKN